MVEFLSGLESVILQRRNAHPNETFLKWKDQEIAWGDFVDHIYAMAAGFWNGTRAPLRSSSNSIACQ